MAKFESEGYCPFNSVMSAVRKEGSDDRLIGLWILFGPKVVCVDDANMSELDMDVVNKMFTDDPISFVLMKSIIEYNVNAEKVALKRIGSGGTQNSSDIQKILSDTKNPKLIVAPRSRYVAIIAEAQYGIDLYYWDLDKT